ncbi:MAG: radical SAM protein [Synergistes sp.]|nr:radical SAM protein [Synergistes sp.]
MVGSTLKKLPFFMPFAGCRGQCVYCNQRAITGIEHIPSPQEVRSTLEMLNEPREVCFFGGSFCRFPYKVIREYLQCVADYAPSGSTVRFSTYPGDLRDDGLRSLIKQYSISRIELGIPTLDSAVLSACKREADPQKIFEDIRTLVGDGLPIGVQMMIGLPGQTCASSLSDLSALAKIKGRDRWDLRLYPCLVIKGTELAALYESGRYVPLTVHEAALWGGRFIYNALKMGFVPIRIGLQETLSLAADTVAGPHCPALGELILAEADAIRLAEESPKGPWRVPKKHISRFTGHRKFGIGRLAFHAGVSPDEVEKRIFYDQG